MGSSIVAFAKFLLRLKKLFAHTVIAICGQGPDINYVLMKYLYTMCFMLVMGLYCSYTYV